MPLSVLLLSDDRPGHYHLSEGVVTALARVRPVQTTKLLVQRAGWIPGRTLAQVLAAGLSPSAVLRVGYGLRVADLPPADLIVSAGGETLVANAAIARHRGIPNVFCGSLRHLPSEAFSLIISSYAQHATLPRHVVALKPSGIDPDKLGSRGIRSNPDAPPRMAGLLIGGDSGRFRYTPAEWRTLLDFLTKSFQAHGTRWMVSTSRRSPDSLGADIAALAANTSGPIAEFIDFRTAGPSTLPRLFASTEAILCTEDSSTMLSEAVCARLPVVAVSPVHASFSADEQGYREFLHQRGWCRSLPLTGLSPESFVAELSKIEPIAENHLDRLAATLRDRLPELFAQGRPAAT
jgi:hypothetical protein